MVAPIIEDSTTMHKDDEYDDGDDAELAVPDPVPASRQSRQSRRPTAGARLLFMSSATAWTTILTADEMLAQESQRRLGTCPGVIVVAPSSLDRKVIFSAGEMLTWKCERRVGTLRLSL